MNPDTKRFLSVQIVWLAISFAISVTLSMLLRFPYSLIAIIAVFISMNYFIRRYQMQRMGMSGTGGGFGGSFLGGGLGQSKPVEYHCISCGTKHNQSACPNCGSRMRKADF
jgi:hypothetical protein